MQVDLFNKSEELLKILANSIHDRDVKAQNDFCFNVAELNAAEQFLSEFIRELQKDCICL
jgi:hypothetical protein